MAEQEQRSVLMMPKCNKIMMNKSFLLALLIFSFYDSLIHSILSICVFTFPDCRYAEFEWCMASAFDNSPYGKR